MTDSDPANEPKDEPIETIVGQARYYTDNYWIKFYKPHERDDLDTTVKLVSAFEKRFQKAVEGGMETTADSGRIREQRRLFSEAGERVKRENQNPHSLQYIKARCDERALGGMLSVSLYHRMVTNIKRHLGYRILQQQNDTAELGKLEATINHELEDAFGKDSLKGVTLLDKLRAAIEKDYDESKNHRSYLRRSGGAEDKDAVLGEMVGEPWKLFSATLSPSLELQQQGVKAFYDNRYKKIAYCWRDIDEVTRHLKKLIATSPRLKDSYLPGIIDNFCASAKERCELMRSDPAFDEAAYLLRSNRNQIMEFALPNLYSSPDEKAADQRIMALVNSYQELVYDVAHVRTSRTPSTNVLVSEIKKLMPVSKPVGPERFLPPDGRGTSPARQ